jgi:phosphomannomutase
VLACDLVVALRNHRRTVLDALDDLALRHGVHTTTAVTRRVANTDEAQGVMARLRAMPPDRLAGFEVSMTDLLQQRDRRQTDALIFFGGDELDWVRMVVRPSGTEPMLKCYIEVRCAIVGDLATTRAKARGVQDELVTVAQRF